MASINTYGQFSSGKWWCKGTKKSSGEPGDAWGCNQGFWTETWECGSAVCVLWRITIPSYGSVFEAIQTVIKSRQFFYGPLHPRIWTHKHQSTYKVVVCPHDEQEKPHEKNNKKKQRSGRCWGGGSSRFLCFYYFMKNSTAPVVLCWGAGRWVTFFYFMLNA